MFSPQMVGWVDASGEGVSVSFAEGYGAYEGLTAVGGGSGGDGGKCRYQPDDGTQ